MKLKLIYYYNAYIDYIIQVICQNFTVKEFLINPSRSRDKQLKYKLKKPLDVLLDAFKSKGSSTMEILNDSSVKDRPFECFSCHRKFTRIENLRRHEKQRKYGRRI